MKNLLVCTWIGDDYRARFLAVKPQFEAYAAACGSDFAVIQSPLDSKGRYGHFTQRLLIPRKFSQYEIVVHMDLDILVPRNLPNIFSQFPASAGFSAVVDPRGSPAYQKAWGFAEWTRESHQAHFEKLGLVSKHSLASINGGVLVFRPPLIADLAEAWYFDESKGDTGTEEAPLAFLSQTNGLFAPLDYRFNRQVLFGLHETPQGHIAFDEYRLLSNRIRRKILRGMGNASHHAGFGPAYRQFVEDLLRNGNLVHFAGRYPVPAVNPELLIGHDRPA